jgi:IS5 family transposase
MLRLVGAQVESLFDEVLPAGVRELPADLARVDALLRDESLLAPIERAWQKTARDFGRPTIAMATFVRLMVVKQRCGWGYETLVREVSDSLHLRRFCLIALSERVPEESTVRKLVRRLGPAVVDEITRVVIGKAQRETRFVARAVRVDSTVVELTCAIRLTRCWRCRARERWRGRGASWLVGCGARGCGWWIARARSARPCA